MTSIQASGSTAAQLERSTRRANYFRIHFLIAICVFGAAVAGWLARVPFLDVEHVKGLSDWMAAPWGWSFGMSMLWILCGLFGVCLLAAVMTTALRSSQTMMQAGWTMMIVSGAALGALAVWYIILIMLVGGALRSNTLCLIPLGAALMAGITALGSLPTPRMLASWGYAHGPGGIVLSRRRVGAAAILGVLTAVIAITGQLVGSRPRVAEDMALMMNLRRNLIVGEGEDRMILPDNGSAILRVKDMPLLGSPLADHIIVSFFDYTDSDSFVTYRSLSEVQHRYGDQVAVMPVVFPLDNRLNERVPAEFAAEHPGAGELARLSLAVWHADPSKFAPFHDYLLTLGPVHRAPVAKDVRQGPAVDEARARAEELVGAQALEQALKDPWLAKQIRLHVAARGRLDGGPSSHAESGFRPQTFWITRHDGGRGAAQGVQGPVKSSARMFEMLEQFLHIEPVNTEVADEDPIRKLLE